VVCLCHAKGPVKQLEVMIKEKAQIGHENGRKKL
jgi:hypothetical protein